MDCPNNTPAAQSGSPIFRGKKDDDGLACADTVLQNLQLQHTRLQTTCFVLGNCNTRIFR